MRCCSPVCVATWVLALASAGAAQSVGSRGRIAFTRLNTDALEIGEPGVIVIRDGKSWRRLWQYFGAEYPPVMDAPSPDSTATPPPVDFTRYMIVAVGYGSTSGCANRAWYVNRIEDAGDRLLVRLGPDAPPEPEITCMMIIHPVDAVRVERDGRRVEFRAARAGYPVPPMARWLTPPTLDAALDTANTVRKQVAWRVLLRDSTLAPHALRRLARAAAAGLGPGLRLLANPRVRESPELLAILGSGEHPSTRAQELLFALHSDAVASNPASDTNALAIVIGMLHDDQPDIARRLVHNSAVRGNQRLLRLFVRQVWRDSVACHSAARAYLTRWPAPYDMAHACEAPRPETRVRLPGVSVAFVCATTFRLLNELTRRVIVAWDTDAGESGSLQLPPRGHRASSEGYITTATRRTLHLYRDGRMFATVGNPGGRPCQVGDTAPPTPPVARLLIPEDTAWSVVAPSEPGTRFYRRLVRVAFYDTTGGAQVRRALERWSATVIAGGPYPSAYVLRIADPGPSWSALDSLLSALREEPEVQDAFPIAVREPVRAR